jgi:hypothetical protein
MMKQFASLLLVATLSAALSSQSIGTPQRHLTDVQMRRLAMSGVKVTAPRGPYLRGFSLDREPGPPYAGRYVGYEATWDPQTPGSAHVGFYVIDPQTGDMWDGVSECGEITSPEIRRLQRVLREQLGLSASVYAKIRRRGPMCDQ